MWCACYPCKDMPVRTAISHTHVLLCYDHFCINSDKNFCIVPEESSYLRSVLNNALFFMSLMWLLMTDDQKCFENQARNTYNQIIGGLNGLKHLELDIIEWHFSTTCIFNSESVNSLSPSRLLSSISSTKIRHYVGEK